MALGDIYYELSYKAKEWLPYLEREHAREKKEVYANALGNIINEIPKILEASLLEAITNHSEYGRYQWMKNELKSLINLHGTKMATVNSETGRVDLYSGMEKYAGTLAEYDAGVAHAREAIKEARGADAERILSQAQRLAYWTKIVWESEFFYPRTMKLRRGVWGEKAPWWYWIEHGNEGMEAYPTNAGTNFVWKAENEATALLAQEWEVVQLEAENILTTAYSRFIENPEGFQPRDVLNEFYAKGKNYIIYVTESGRRVGVRQQ